MKIGFIGLGKMGVGMAANLQKAGHELVVNDLVESSAKMLLDEGATWATSPRALAEDCNLVFTSLPTPAVVKSVCFGEEGLSKGLGKGAVWFDLSTNAVDVVRDLHQEMSDQGVFFLDAPVSGGPAGAASGKLAIWVGGNEAVFGEFKPVLDDMSDQVLYIGNIGAGSIAKLTHNMASTAFTAVLAESLTMGVKAGVDPLNLWEAIRSGAAGRMRSFDNLSKRFLQGNFDPPSFALNLVDKDVSLALRLGREYSVPMRLCNLVAQDITEAMNRGWGDRDCQSYLLLQQERADVPPFTLTEEEINGVVQRT